MKSGIVIIDDDDEDVLFFRLIFQELRPDTELFWYPSAPTFLEAYTAGTKFRLILLNYHLPNQTGTDWLPTFLSHPCCQGIPVVIIAGIESKKHQQEAIEAGAAGFLVKPNSQEDLKKLAEYIIHTWLTN
ncbi:response regulator [Larkinella rosea]|uniref:Response regulator n=1 Tax=Larkinella rosea TaxID=2025312 RepID=A0A3P1BYW3_9BACT|nr:response regulator [Larkinella rosea]RRB06281.1 response regulator [Larkinella rosea]